MIQRHFHGLKGSFLAAAVFACTAATVVAGDDEAKVIRGAEVVGGPVTPVTVHVQLEDLAPAPRWRQWGRSPFPWPPYRVRRR